MKTFSRKNTMAALLLAGATVGLPTTSYADPAKSSHRYHDCKEADREGQLIGGLLGAVAGGVAGREVAGRGDRTEGAAIGAVVGAVAGAAIADKDCGDRRYRQTYRTPRTGHTYGRDVGYNNNRHYGARTYQTRQSYPYSRNRNRGYDRGYNRGYDRGNRYLSNGGICSSRWGYSAGQRSWDRRDSLKQRIQWEMKELRREREYLIDQRRYSRYDRDIDRRLYQIGVELDHLKKELRYVKKGRSYRDYDRVRYRWDNRGYRDGYGRTNYSYRTNY